MWNLAFLWHVPILAAALIIGLTSARADNAPGRPAPQTVLPGLAGQAGLTAGTLGQGRVVVVNFFASWCLPCRAEHPVLMKLAAEKGFDLIGIAYKDDPAETAGWLADHGNPFARVGVDRDGAAGDRWGLIGLPNTFVVDGAGRIRLRHIGPLFADTVEGKILPVVRGLAAAGRGRPESAIP